MPRDIFAADSKASTAATLSREVTSSTTLALPSSARQQRKTKAGSPNDRLRALRAQHGLTTRKVADLSQQVAMSVGRKECGLSHARLLQIENGESTPSIYKLFSLSVIYGKSIANLLSLYIEPEAAGRCHLELESPNTHPIETDLPSDETIEFPIEFTPAAAEQWNEVHFGIGHTVGTHTRGAAVPPEPAQLPLRRSRAVGLHDVSARAARFVSARREAKAVASSRFVFE